MPSVQMKMGLNLHDPENIIIMLAPLEKRFHLFQWTAIPEDPEVYRVSLNCCELCVSFLPHSTAYCVCQLGVDMM